MKTDDWKEPDTLYVWEVNTTQYRYFVSDDVAKLLASSLRVGHPIVEFTDLLGSRVIVKTEVINEMFQVSKVFGERTQIILDNYKHQPTDHEPWEH